MKKLVLTCCYPLFILIVWGQNTAEISGTVVDNTTGVPIPGANIIEKGTSNGTMTDFDGNFNLEVPVNVTLVISSIG